MHARSAGSERAKETTREEVEGAEWERMAEEG